jgi:predicted transcriptional regulator
MAVEGIRITDSLAAEIIRLTVAKKTQEQIAAELGIAKSTVWKYQKASGKDVSGSGVPDTGVVSFKSDGEQASGEYVTAKVPTEQTLAGILKECGADLTTWEVKEWSYRAWTTSMMKKGKGDVEDQVIHGKQYSIHVKFKRIMPVALQKATDAVFERMANYAPKYVVPRYKKPKGGLLAGAFIFDHHFGRLCWGRETGEDYDLKIASVRFNNAVDDMVAHMKMQGAERAVFPVGNDYFHVDSRYNTTFNGTPQDVDGRLEKVFEAGELSVIRAVEMMSAVCPVDVIWVGGNHDLTLSYVLSRTVSAWFRNHKGVTVDCEPKTRKYYRWKSNLIGLCHSDREKIGDLALLMATERPDDWADTVCREFVVGHRHHPEKWQTKPVDSKCGVAVRTIRTLTGADAYHSRAGYVGEPKAAELHYYNANTGHDSYKLIYARD